MIYEIGDKHAVDMSSNSDEDKGSLTCEVKDLTRENTNMKGRDTCPMCGSELRKEFLKEYWFDL